jgi:lysophospholipase L1-like esterase
MSIHPIKNFAQKSILATFSTLLFLAISEGAARYYYQPKTLQSDTIFEYDAKKSFRLKSNYTGTFIDRPITTNEYGYRGNSFPIKKDPFEWRVVTLGDSVTFGHGVNREDTFTEKYKASLSAELKNRTVTIINTGVPGYSSMQEYHDFLDTLKFDPDIAILQFTLNDVTEPFFFQVKLGGTGLDYHQVPDMSFWHFYLSQHSALYLFLIDISKYIRFGLTDKKTIQTSATYNDSLTNQQLVTHPEKIDSINQWNEYFLWLKKYADTCKREAIHCYVLISPYTFQLELSETKAYPQQKIIDFSKENSLEYIDMLSIFRSLIQQEIIDKYLLPADTTYDFLLQNHFDDIRSLETKYFLDYNHYSALGHTVVSEQLFHHVEKPTL